MTHPATLRLALRDAGMTCRTAEGKLLVNPVASLAGELREQVVANRAALIEHLEGEADWLARADALAADAFLWNPFDRPGQPPPVLLRLHADGEPPEYAACDPAWLDDFAAWASYVRRANAEGAARNAKKKAKKPARSRGAPEAGNTYLGGF